MIQVRQNVFETNSSLTHCLVICKENEYIQWVNGEVMFSVYTHKFLPNSEARKYNASRLREVLEWIQSRGGDTITSRKSQLTEEKIQKYEAGELKDTWAVFTVHDIDNYYITYEQWQQYVSNYYYESIDEVETIDGNKIRAFGYYGHD